MAASSPHFKAGNMTLDEFLDRLEGVRPAGRGFNAICPSHEDNEASLNVAEGDEGLLVKCYAGCETSAVLAAMGLTWPDIFFRSSTNYSEPEAIYDYVDESGNALFQVCRFPGKKFRQRHLGEEGEWVWNLDNVRRVLYRLPEVLRAVSLGQTIYLTEGEKDVENLRAFGKVATCNPGGAGKWKPEYTEQLRGANVVIVRDRDEPGRAHAEKVKSALIGVAAGVWVVQAKRGKDVSDHLAAGFAVEQLVPAREPLRRGVITSRELADMAMERLELGPSDLPSYQPTGITEGGDLGPLTFRPGRLYALGGYTGDGKSTLALQAGVGLARGGVSCGYFTNEMTGIDLQNRIIVKLSGLPLALVEEPWLLTPQQRDLYVAATEELRSWPLDIVFDTGVNAEVMAEHTLNGEYDFVILDHVHRFTWGRERRDLDAQIVGLTNIALEFNIPVLALCQLRRSMRGKDMEVYPLPTLQDFKETSTIEQEAALAMAIWRTRIDSTRYDPAGGSQLLVLKNRHSGVTGSYFLTFNKQTMNFESGGVVHDVENGAVPRGDVPEDLPPEMGGEGWW